MIAELDDDVGDRGRGGPPFKSPGAATCTGAE